jgi:hypothetical protein
VRESRVAQSLMKAQCALGLVTSGTQIALCFLVRPACRPPTNFLSQQNIRSIAKDCRLKVEKIFILGNLLGVDLGGSCAFPTSESPENEELSLFFVIGSRLAITQGEVSKSQ